MVNYFELYDIPVSFHPDQALVKKKYYELSRLYHPDRYTLAGPAEQVEALKLSSANNQAYNTLKDADATMKYILKMHGVVEDEEKYNLPPAFLMEMMDLNEAISEYEMDPGNEEQLLLAQKMMQQQLQEWDDVTAPLTRKYDAGDHSEGLLLQIKEHYFRKKYLQRISERMSGLS